MEELSVISVTYEIYKKTIELNTQVDKKYRHTLSESAVAQCVNTLEQLVLAKHAPKPLKSGYLVKAEASAETPPSNYVPFLN